MVMPSFSRIVCQGAVEDVPLQLHPLHDPDVGELPGQDRGRGAGDGRAGWGEHVLRGTVMMR